MNRRKFLASASTIAVATMLPHQEVFAASKHFPKGFLWGAATAAHQVEGNNVSSDLWLIEHLTPTFFAEPSGDADNSFGLWSKDLDLVRAIGLNTYRFSIEWARIEPEPGKFSIAMLDHYKAMIDGCRERGIMPFVTFMHFTTPRWFAERGAWCNNDSPELFARFCDRAARHLADAIGYVATLNEPNVAMVLAAQLGPRFEMLMQRVEASNAAAMKATGSDAFRSAILPNPSDFPIVQTHLIAAHKSGKAAIRAVRRDLPVGVTLSISDDQAVGEHSVRDARRASQYAAWLEAVKGDDFLGVQNYSRVLWGDEGRLPAPVGARLNAGGDEVYAPSLANSVRYAYESTKVPILVSEHGVNADDDSLRTWLIPEALSELHKIMTEGVPVKGYIHWSLLDNFEWFLGYKPRYGLCSVDRTTFKRTPKPSSTVLGAIARRNAL